jgi:GNAT superfamily N-acetyltransferase
MTDYTIRPMQASDTVPIAQWVAAVPLWQRYRIQPDVLATQLESAIERDDLLFTLVLPGDSVPRGFVWCLRQGAFGRSPYIRLIGVHPDYAGQGLGAALLDHVEAVCQEFADRLFLLVSDFNLDAQRFYQQHGYQQVGAVPAFVLPDVNELIYCKRLKE